MTLPPEKSEQLRELVAEYDSLPAFCLSRRLELAGAMAAILREQTARENLKDSMTAEPR